MKARFKTGLGFLAWAISSFILMPLASHGQPQTAEEIRREYHQQGFKTDVSDFNFTVSKEMSERGAALTNKGPIVSPQPDTFLENADLLTPVNDDSAIVVWKGPLAYSRGFRGYSYLYDPGTEKDAWPAQRGLVEESREKLNAATKAILSGPYGFDLNASRGLYMPLRHVADLKRFTQMFAGAAMVALRDGEQDAAWTNLLAATRMVTAWQIEPAAVSQDVRLVCLETAYDATWQALQSTNWRDAQLAQLQHEWESLDVFQPLPDVVAFYGAGCIAALHQGIHVPVGDAEKNLLIFYHDREVEMRRAVQSQSWAQMRLGPDITNIFFLFPPRGKIPQALEIRMNLFRMNTGMASGGVSLAGRTSEAETRRRLLITAIALERYRLRHGGYPKTLDALAPDFVKTVPLDFMNGQPFHYSVDGGGHFLLYSVGLNGKDDGGKINPVPEHVVAVMTHHDPDILWPLPASAKQATAYAEGQRKQMEEKNAAIRQREAEDKAREEAARRAAIKELLSNPKYKKVTWNSETTAEGGEVIYKGQPLTKLLHNEKSTGTNVLSLDDLLTLRESPLTRGIQDIVYELPISYDNLTNNLGDLDLIMDSPPDDSALRQPQFSMCRRATNGDCLLVWSAAADAPGQHALQAWLMLPAGIDREAEIRGPVLPFLSTNLIQFSMYGSQFDERGADLDARLAESNASFSIEIKTRSGSHLRTLTGSTTNGLIHAEWNLMDDKGNKFTNNSFLSDFQVILPSGRSQTLPRILIRAGTRGN